MMECLNTKTISCITDCVFAELEKLGQKYRVALRIVKDLWWIYSRKSLMEKRVQLFT